MEQEKQFTNDLRCIRSAKLAKILINKGFVVKDIKPNKQNKEMTVFLFEKTPELLEIVKSFLDNESENDVVMDEKFLKEWRGKNSY